MNRRLKRVAVAAAILATLIGLRLALEPREGPRPHFRVDGAERTRVSEQVTAGLLDPSALDQRLGDAKVLLIGEEHFTNEIVAYTLGLLEKLSAHGRPVVLLLELPQHTQPTIDRFMNDGREDDLRGIWRDGDALPYQRLVQWARQSRPTVRRVVAMDENRRRVVVMRALLTDTRNESMSTAILKARREEPDALVVAYGGQFHMLRSGRYLYDVANRESVGSRLRRAGIPPAELRVILVSGADRFPIAETWTRPGAIAAESPLGDLPYEAFFRTHVFGAAKARELFDYFVNVGPLTASAP